ncbi:MAG TPA: STM3941 family protein [Anaerolineales bacterium]|nr:STM3941 family protein [Anaerolineales bacterium]
MKNQLPIKLYAKNRYLLVLMNIILLAISGVFVFSDVVGNRQQLDTSVLLRIIGLFSIVFFGFGFVTSLRMIFQPAIIVDDEGIVDRASGTAVGRIPWSNISKAEVIRGSNYIGILPKNMDLLINHCGIFVRSMLRRRIANGRPPIIIPASILGIDAVQLVEEINSRKPMK